jgi:hypothetical protein
MHFSHIYYSYIFVGIYIYNIYNIYKVTWADRSVDRFALARLSRPSFRAAAQCLSPPPPSSLHFKAPTHPAHALCGLVCSSFQPWLIALGSGVTLLFVQVVPFMSRDYVRVERADVSWTL